MIIIRVWYSTCVASTEAVPGGVCLGSSSRKALGCVFIRIVFENLDSFYCKLDLCDSADFLKNMWTYRLSYSDKVIM